MSKRIRKDHLLYQISRIINLEQQRKNDRETKNPEPQELQPADPIICNGIADIIIQPSTENEAENENIM